MNLGFYNTNLPPHLRVLKDEIEGYAREYGLDFFETIFEVVDADDLNEIAAYGGFPTRYPHWSFGMQDEVEAFMDKCMSIDDLIDIHSVAIKRRDDHSKYDFNPANNADDPAAEAAAQRFKAKPYMADYINPPGAVKAEDEEQKKQATQR